ncbi:MAG: hypothetical protein P4L51_25330 [Puia sp.]|nr:hypothetical protein [Puia sp.]
MRNRSLASGRKRDAILDKEAIPGEGDHQGGRGHEKKGPFLRGKGDYHRK